MENRSVKKIFREEGEEYFRNLEQKTANWIEKSVNSSLISCGGGFYKGEFNIDKLGKGHSIRCLLLEVGFYKSFGKIGPQLVTKSRWAKGATLFPNW